LWEQNIMTDKIDGFGRAGVDIRPAKSRATGASQKSDAASAKVTRAASARDAVQITDTATHLKRIEAGLADVPDIDRGRVEAVRRKIESGDYEVNPARVAQKLLRLEQDLS
jgi:negative regulator of flagellin synthesis FlgM